MDDNNFFNDFNTTQKDLSLSGSYHQDHFPYFLIKVDGYLDTDNSHLFLNTISTVIKQFETLNFLIFDLEKLQYISSTGIGVFTTFYMEMKKTGVRLFLVKPRKKVEDVFKLLGYANFFNIVTSLEEVFQNPLYKDSIFPKVIKCTNCNRSLKIIKSGKFSCPGCQQKILVNQEGTLKFI